MARSLFIISVRDKEVGEIHAHVGDLKVQCFAHIVCHLSLTCMHVYCTSKCGKNISDTLGYTLRATFLFLRHFDVICDLLLNRRTATWNPFVK